MQSFLDFFYNTHINYYFLSDVTWNLFLALVPCALIFFMYRILKGKKWHKIPYFERILFVSLLFGWLFFLPNTTYLFTMVRHLTDYCEPDTVFRVCRDEVWKILFFFGYSLIGLPAFLYALERMTRIVAGLFGKTAGFLFPIFIIPINTLGLLLGLVRRFNSWDALQYPLFTLKDTLYYLSKPSTLANFFFYMAGLYVIYYGSLLFIRQLTRK